MILAKNLTNGAAFGFAFALLCFSFIILGYRIGVNILAIHPGFRDIFSKIKFTDVKVVKIPLG